MKKQKTMNFEEYADMFEHYLQKHPTLTKDQVLKLMLIQAIEELTRKVNL